MHNPITPLPTQLSRSCFVIAAIIALPLCGVVCACSSMVVLPLFPIGDGSILILEGLRALGLGILVDLIPTPILTVLYVVRDTPLIGVGCCGVAWLAAIGLWLATGRRAVSVRPSIKPQPTPTAKTPGSTSGTGPTRLTNGQQQKKPPPPQPPRPRPR